MAAGGWRTDTGNASTASRAPQGLHVVVPYNYSVAPGSGPVGAYPYVAATVDPYAAAATAKTAIAYQPIFLPDGTTMMQPVLVPAQPAVPGGWQWTPMPAPFDMAAAMHDGARPAPFYAGMPPQATMQHQQPPPHAPPPTMQQLASHPLQAPFQVRPSRPPLHQATSAVTAYQHAQLAHGFQEATASPAQHDIDARNAGPFSLVAEGLLGEEDVELECTECHKTFAFCANEQLFFIQRGYRVPQRCKACRTVASQVRAAAHAPPLQVLQGDLVIGPCRSCHLQFVFSTREQEFFQERQFPYPVRCLECRRFRRQPSAAPTQAVMQTISLTPPPAYTSQAPNGVPNNNIGAFRASSRPAAARPALDPRVAPSALRTTASVAAVEPPTTGAAPVPTTAGPPLAAADPLPAAMEALTVG